MAPRTIFYLTMRFSKNLLGVLATGFLLSPAAFAQSADAQIQKGIDFAEGLASRWQFVDLAQEVLDELESGTRLSAEQEENIALVRCEIFGTAARRERDADRRIERFTEALKAYDDFIGANEFSDFKADAERSAIQLAYSFSKALEMRLMDEVGEAADATRKLILDVLEKPIQDTGSIIADLNSIPDPTELQRRAKYAMMLDRGRMLAAKGRASEDGTFFFGQAEVTLEDLAMLAGERTGWGLQAYLELASAKGGQGDWEMAMIYFEFVTELVMPADKGAWDSLVEVLSPADKEQHWYYMELALPGLLDACANYGDTGTASKWALVYFNRFKSEGFQLSRPNGYLALLASAGTLLDNGGFIGGSINSGDLEWYPTEDAMKSDHSQKRNRRTAVDLALSMAQTANEDNKGQALQQRAQKLIAEVIERPGVKIGPDVLFEAAKGHYKSQEYLVAIDACKRVLRSLEGQDQATRTTFGPEVLHFLGKSFFNEGRYMEAAMAFQDGVTTWKGDPAFDSLNAKGMYEALKFQKRASNDDADVVALWRIAENHVAGTADASDAGELLFSQAERAFGTGDYALAFTKYGAVPNSTDSYEKALTKQGVCRYRQDRLADARKIFEDYLGPYLTDPKNQTSSERRLAKRSDAMAEATFYLGMMSYNAEQWAGAIEHLGGFYAQFPKQNSMAPNAMYMALRAELATDDVDGARSIYDVMLADFSKHKYTGKGALRIYTKVKDDYEASQVSKDELGDLAMLRVMAELKKTENGLIASPDYLKLRSESGHWRDLGEWEEAARVLRVTADAFAEDTERRPSIYKFALPELGEALINLDRLPDAIEVLRPLIPPTKTPEGEPEPEFKPSGKSISYFCRAAVGWVEGERSSSVTEILGVGTPEDVALAAQWLAVLTNREDKYEAAWYQLKFDTIFAWRRWSQTETDKREGAVNQISTLQQDVEDDFSGIQKDMNEKGFNGDMLRQHFIWLNKKLN
jgi:TolA-binding protein